ncbi:MAG: hypothetical protein E7049_07280 [Lentisphaerae bacterium]|nr:hypothetical protein [Lentisphaerota bacterium]
MAFFSGSVDADTISAYSPSALTSAYAPATGRTLSESDNTTLVSQGINLPVGGYITISGEVKVAAVFAQGDSEIRFADENSSLTVSGPVYVADSNTLTITPAALSVSGTKTLITASVIGSASNLSVTPPTESGYTYTASIGDKAVTLTRKPVPSKTYTAAIGSWNASGWGSFAGGTAVEKVRVGPNAALSTVFEISSGFCPYVGFQAPSSSSWSFSVYADVSKASNSTTSRPVLACFGDNNSSDTLLLYREGDYVKLRRQKNGAAVAGWAASVPVADGFHLWTFACDPTTGTVSLYVDDGAASSSSNIGHSSHLLGEMNLPAGFQLGKVYGANLSGFTTGEGIAVASFQYYDTYITADDVAMLAAQYPATDGTAIYGQVDNLGAWNNHQTENNTMGSSLTVYSGAYPGDTTTGKWVYLGISQGTLTIPSGNTVSVPFFKTNNKSSAGNVTVDIAGTLNVTSTADSDIYSANKGILFGHYKGTGTYDITGELIGRSTYLMGCFSAGDQTINVNGGLLAVKGFSMRDGDGGNATVNLTNNGTVEVAAAQTLGNKDVIRNFGYGTYKVVADVTDSKAITFTGTAEQPTTLDPAGHTLTLNSAAMGGTGYMTVADSVGGGCVVFVGSSTATLILTDANAASIDISGYTGKVLYQGTAATLAKLNGFAGTVYFTESVDASAIDLSGATVNVAADCRYTAIAGQEGTMVLASGATVKLMVTTEVSNYEGHVASVSGAGSVEYWLSDDEQTQLTGEDHLNGNNLLPYYYVWTPSETASENTISANADARWKVGSLPTANKNVAFKISGATTVLVDATVSYGEVQVYGTGTLTFQSADGTAAMTVAKKLQTTSTTAVQIDSGIVFGAGAELEVVSALPLYMTAVNCGTEAAPYEIPAITGGGIAYVAEGKYLTTAEINAGTFYALGNATVSDSAAIGTLQVPATGVLTLDSATVAVSGTATIRGTVNVDSASTFNPSAVSGAGTVVWTGKQPDCTKSSSSVWVQSSWSGTNVVVNVGVYNTEIFPQYWGRDGSYIRVSKVMGYITNNNRVNAELILDNGEYNVAFQPANGNSNDNPVTLRKITGDGTLKDANDNGVLDYIIRDATEYTGSIDLSSGPPSRAYVFSSASTTYPARNTYRGCIYVNTDGYAKIGDGKLWSVASGKAVHILGEVELAGAGSISGPVTVSGISAKLTLANSALSLNSALTLSEGYALEIEPGTIALSETPATLITGLTNTEAPDVTGITVAGCTVSVGGSSGAYTIQATLGSGIWARGDGNWTETSFNGTEQSTDGSAVTFRASANAAVTVTLTGTRAPSTVTFNGGSATTYTLTGGTFSPSGTVTVESGSVTIESAATGTYVVNAGATLSLTNATVTSVSGAGTLNIPAGGVVTLTSATALDSLSYITGEGELHVGANIPETTLNTLLKKSYTVNAETAYYWQGTVVIENFVQSNDTSVGGTTLDCGNASSTIQLKNCTIRYFNQFATEAALEIVGTVKTLNGSGTQYSHFGKLKGTGSFILENDVRHLYRFTSGEEFTGSIEVTGRRVVFGNEGTGSDTTDRDAYYGTIRIGSVYTATLGAGSHWTAFNGVIVSGSVVVKGANSYIEHNNSGVIGVVLNDGATIRFDSLSTLKFGNNTLRTPTVAAGSTVNIAFGDGVTPVAGTKLISWGGAPEGSFAFADSTLGDSWILAKETDGLYVQTISAIEFGDATFDYTVNYTGAETVVASVTGEVSSPANTTWTLTVGGKSYTGTYTAGANNSGTVTFRDVTGLTAGQSNAYTITATGAATGTTDNKSAIAAKVLDGWIAEDSTNTGKSAAGGAWNPAITYSGTTATFSGNSTNTFNATSRAAGTVTLTTVVNFGDVADAEVNVDSGAKAAIRVGASGNSNVFQLWSRPSASAAAEWLTVEGATPNIEESSTVVFTFDTLAGTYSASVNGSSLLYNSSTSFLVASDGETIGSVSYVGAGTFTSLSGNYTTTNIIESVSGTNIVVDAKFIADYMSGKTVSEATAALSPSAAKGTNGLNAFEAYALGLAPSAAQPVLGVTVSEEGKFVVTMKNADGTEITSAPNVQLVTKVKSGDAPGSFETSEGGDTIDPAQQNVPVKYYKAEVEILAK